MRLSSVRKAGATAVAGGLLLASGTTPAAVGEEGLVKILGLKQVGDLVIITLFNPGYAPLTGNLVIEVVVEGRSSLEQVPVSVFGGQKVFVVVDFPAPEAKIIPAGIILDDGAPI